MASTDRIAGVLSSLGVKAPVRAATTAAITLSGAQTIDGIACVEGDRVLVKNQAAGSANGIYDVSTGTWTRSADFDGARDVVQGTLVSCGQGTTNADSLWRLTTANPITLGTTSLTFTLALSGAAGATGPAGAAGAAGAAGDISGGGTVSGDIVMTGNAAIEEARANITQHATTMNFWTGPNIQDGAGSAVTITACVNAPQAGVRRMFYPLAGTILTHGATFDIDGNANQTAAAGDCWEIVARTVSTYRVHVIKDSGAPASMSQITNSLGADVALSNTALYFDGPIVAQGTVGTWFVSGTVTCQDTTAGANGMNIKLWDGTTVIASTQIQVTNFGGSNYTASLSGFIVSPAGNLRISVNGVTTTAGLIKFNGSGNSKDSTITAIRIA